MLKIEKYFRECDQAKRWRSLWDSIEDQISGKCDNLKPTVYTGSPSVFEKQEAARLWDPIEDSNAMENSDSFTKIVDWPVSENNRIWSQYDRARRWRILEAGLFSGKYIGI